MKIDIEKVELSPNELDKQSEIKIVKWLDIGSEECKDNDPDVALAKKWLKMGAEDKFLFVDRLGRIWGRASSGSFFPYHFNVGDKNYGYRLAINAAN